MGRKRSGRRSRQPPFERIALFRNEITTWFRTNQREFPWRKPSATSYEQVISEILLKRTQAEMVARFLPSFLITYPSWEVLSSERTDMLEQRLKPLGLAATRSKALSRLATEIEERQGEFPKTRKELEKLPGVGPYVASAVLLFCFGEREPLLDTNMARILERVFGPRMLADLRFDPYLRQLSKSIVDVKDSIHVNWGIIDFAALICKRANPRCLSCPLARFCRFVLTQGGTQRRYNRRLASYTMKAAEIV